MNDKGPCHLWAAIAGWASRLGVRRIDQLPGCWETDEFEFEGMPTRIAFNGRDEPTPPSFSGVELSPFQCLVEVNGWPAILVDPGGGVIVGGEPDIEDRLIAAFEATVESEP